MASFCEGCPSKGNCVGPIDEAYIESCIIQGTVAQDGRSALFVMENGVPQGPTTLTVRYVDDNNGRSEPVQVDGISRLDAANKALEHIDRVDRCDGPTKTRHFFGLVTKQVCSAPNC